MVKSTQIIKNRLYRQFCSEKLLQIGKNTFQEIGFVAKSGRELEKHNPFIF